MHELSGIADSVVNYAVVNEIMIVEDLEIDSKNDDVGEFILTSLQKILNGDQDTEEQSNTIYRSLISRYEN